MERTRTLADHCAQCDIPLTGIDIESGAVLGYAGQEPARACCCGSIDHGHYVEAYCTACCGPHYPTRGGGSGYYLTSPR